MWGREGGGVDSAINMAGSHTPSEDGTRMQNAARDGDSHVAANRAALRLAARTTHACAFTEDK